MLYIILYIIIHTITGAITHQCFIENNKSYSEWFALTIYFAPIMFIAALIMYPSFFFGWMIPKKKPRPIVPGTYNGYLWGEVVMIDGIDKAIVVGEYQSCLYVIYINQNDVESVGIDRITSTNKPSELAEELAMYDQANKLLAKADDIVKEAGEIKIRAVKKRSNLIYVP